MVKFRKVHITPIYEQVCEYLKEQIQMHKLLVGQKLSSEPELAIKFNVSRPTLRKALQILVAEGLLLRRPGKGTFVTEPKMTKHTRTENRPTIGVIVRDISYYFADVIKGIENVAYKHNYRIVLCSSDMDHKKESEYLHNLREDKVAGIIIEPSPDIKKSHCMRLRKDNIPFVMVEKLIKNFSCDYVVTDNVYGAKIAVEYLIKLDHRKIGYIGQTIQSDYYSATQRLNGYKQTLQTNGLKINKGHICLIDSLNDKEWDKIKDYLIKSNRPTAVFCYSDLFAQKLFETALDLGIKVPENLSIIGFDDSEIALSTKFPLTSIAPQKYQMGKKAGQVLISKIKKNKTPLFKQIMLKTRLIKRKSCGMI